MSASPFHLQDCSFHPSEKLLAAGLITGQVRLSEYTGTSATRRSQKRLHSESCRALQFSSRGDFLLTGSADKSIVVLDTTTCKVQKTHQGAHPAGISRLVALSESTFASGVLTGFCFALHTTLHATGHVMLTVCATIIWISGSITLHFVMFQAMMMA